MCAWLATKLCFNSSFARTDRQKVGLHWKGSNISRQQHSNHRGRSSPIISPLRVLAFPSHTDTVSDMSACVNVRNSALVFQRRPSFMSTLSTLAGDLVNLITAFTSCTSWSKYSHTDTFMILWKESWLQCWDVWGPQEPWTALIFSQWKQRWWLLLCWFLYYSGMGGTICWGCTFVVADS